MKLISLLALFFSLSFWAHAQTKAIDGRWRAKSAACLDPKLTVHQGASNLVELIFVYGQESRGSILYGYGDKGLQLDAVFLDDFADRVTPEDEYSWKWSHSYCGRDWFYDVSWKIRGEQSTWKNDNEFVATYLPGNPFLGMACRITEFDGCSKLQIHWKRATKGEQILPSQGASWKNGICMNKGDVLSYAASRLLRSGCGTIPQDSDTIFNEFKLTAPVGTVVRTSTDHRFKRVQLRSGHWGWQDLSSGGKTWIDVAPGAVFGQKSADEVCHKMHWQLPSGYPRKLKGRQGFPKHDSDFIVAESHGFREVATGAGTFLWSSSLDLGYLAFGLDFSDGHSRRRHVDEEASVWCLAP